MGPISDEKLEELKEGAQHYIDRRERAASRLAGDIEPQWCWAMVGLPIDVQEFNFAESLVIRPVIEPPEQAELIWYLGDKSHVNSVGRYSHAIGHELALRRDRFKSEEQAASFSWVVFAAIRVRSLAEFLIPAFANYSWSSISAVSDGSSMVRPVEDIPGANRFDSSRRVGVSDLQWVANHLTQFAKLLKNPRFHLAVECLTTHPFEATERMAAASLWVGFESIFKVDFELRFRLSALAASLLEPRGQKRIATYKKIKSLYDFRSRLIHGASVDTKKIVSHICEVREFLSLVLQEIVERKKMPDWDAVLFE